MSSRLSIFIFSLILSSVYMWACSSGGSNEPKEEKIMLEPEEPRMASELLQKARNFFKVLPEPASFERPIAKLGKDLYYETALSVNGELSCNSCHLLDEYGVDNEATSPGHDGTRGDRNSPSVYNTSFHIAQFWDGRAASLHEQAKGPILNPIEMGLPNERTAEKNIQAIPEYQEKFKEVFPDQNKPISYENITMAIAEFEKTLHTPSDFDEFLEGNENALTEEEKNGLQNFIDAGCITCHSGVGLGGHMYQKFGLVKGPYWEYTKSNLKDEGRAAVSGNDAEKYLFKVASLRNVSETGPYFHDGSVSSLEEAVKIMGVTQLNKKLSTDEVSSIVSFLNSLKGEIPQYALREKKS